MNTRYFVDYETFIKFYKELEKSGIYKDCSDSIVINAIDFKRLTELHPTKDKRYSITPPLIQKGSSWEMHADYLRIRGKKLCMEITADELKYFPYSDVIMMNLVDNYYMEEKEEKELYLLQHPKKVYGNNSIGDVEYNAYLEEFYSLGRNKLFYKIDKVHSYEYQITAIYNKNKVYEEDLLINIGQEYPEELKDCILYMKMNNNHNFEIADLPEREKTRNPRRFRGLFKK